MPEQTVITFKDTKGFKEAIRRVAFAEGHSNNSQVIIDSLLANPAIARELKNISKKTKK